MSDGEATVSIDISERDGGRLAHVVVDNERRLNCLGRAQVERLQAAFETLSSDDELRAIVLTGAGTRAFIGGADLGELRNFDTDAARNFITALAHACRAIRECPVPVIGRINGYALGAGLEVAAACDMRVCVDSAMLGMPEVKMGLPSVIDAALFPGLVGWGRTRQLLLLGENVSAADGLAMGLVEKVVPAADLDSAVEGWVASIYSNAPQSVRSQKALINRWQRSSLEEGIMAGIDALAAAYDTGEPQAAIADFFAEKAKRQQ